MTEDDYKMVTSRLTAEDKKFFDSVFAGTCMEDETNHLMSLGGIGLLKKINDHLSKEEVAERRKEIPKFLHYLEQCKAEEEREKNR